MNDYVYIVMAKDTDFNKGSFIRKIFKSSSSASNYCRYLTNNEGLYSYYVIKRKIE